MKFLSCSPTTSEHTSPLLLIVKRQAISMRFAATNLLSLLICLSVGYSAPVSDDIPTLIVSNFGAFVSVKEEVRSFVSFHVKDPRPDYYFETNCTFSPPEVDGRNTIYLEGYIRCDTSDLRWATGFAWWMGEDFLALRRNWRTDPDDNDYPYKTFVSGLTGKVDPWWNGSRIGYCGNVTKTQAGTFYDRTTDWEFPIHTIMS
ncbi:hypothetical protein K491DRAFT_781595 [Lophiostoma macrostomum CBS 122681]|uniref:Uncharacterized protein n=1 Tax=Lophiostoma macrostomum CBS 122681 TaxID=1314788 RepID=A0A6A6SVQ5_9PLEO|nr:hypothetical protein K491DRAFT_781595 [Lophiostoma macrostomum CBS 122681]